MKPHIAALFVSAALIAAPGTVSAKEILGIGTPDATQFRAKASASDAFEILSSKIALTHATRDDIRDFAQMMIHDHTASTDELVALGGISKASLKTKMEPGPDGKYRTNDLLDSDHSTELNSLDSKSNRDFDQTYIADQVRVMRMPWRCSTTIPAMAITPSSGRLRAKSFPRCASTWPRPRLCSSRSARSVLPMRERRGRHRPRLFAFS
ncbi:MAG TPA: DUF4142 domain-containing protein [Rhizomicrobium sp.]